MSQSYDQNADPERNPNLSPENWTDREMERLARNQHDLRNSINAMQLANVASMTEQTKELADRISASQKDTSRELAEAIKHVETAVEKRVDKLELDLRTNATQVSEIKMELTTVKVRVAMWCAIGAMLASVLSAVITAVIIRSVVH